MFVNFTDVILNICQLKKLQLTVSLIIITNQAVILTTVELFFDSHFHNAWREKEDFYFSIQYVSYSLLN